jgi:hypothetical protein
LPPTTPRTSASSSGIVAAFEPDGYLREAAGDQYVHRGADELRALYERRASPSTSVATAAGSPPRASTTMSTRRRAHAPSAAGQVVRARREA